MCPLSVFSWLLVDALHLQRMLTEMRDINHGHMKFYVSMGFGLPAVIVGLSVGKDWCKDIFQTGYLSIRNKSQKD